MGKKLFLLIKILLAFISLLGVFLFKFGVFNISQKFLDIFFNICVGVFSSMILVFFIDEISRHIQERKSLQDELEYIRRFNIVISLYIERYKTMFYCVTTPLDKRNFKEISMPEKFSLKEMIDLHENTLLTNDGFFDSSVDAFMKIELMIRNEMISLVERYDFTHYPQFVNLFINFIQLSIIYDCRAAISENNVRIKNNYSFRDTLRSVLLNNADDYYLKMKCGEMVPSNIVNPYIFLYEMMNEQRKIILEYQSLIEKILNETNTKKKNKKQ